MSNEVASCLLVAFQIDMNESRCFSKVKGEVIVQVKGKTLLFILNSYRKIEPQNLGRKLTLKQPNLFPNFLTSKAKRASDKIHIQKFYIAKQLLSFCENLSVAKACALGMVCSKLDLTNHYQPSNRVAYSY